MAKTELENDFKSRMPEKEAFEDDSVMLKPESVRFRKRKTRDETISLKRPFFYENGGIAIAFGARKAVNSCNVSEHMKGGQVNESIDADQGNQSKMY